MKRNKTKPSAFPGVLLSALLIFFSVSGTGQVSITSSALVYNQNFDNFQGTAASVTSDLPGWTVTVKDDKYQGRGCGNSTTGAAYAFGSGSDYALGYLPSSSVDKFTARVTFVNNTGAVITALAISYDFENWRREARLNGFSVTSNIAGANVSGLSETSPTGGSGNCSAVSTPKSVSLSGLSIANGATFYIEWVGDRGGGSGSSQGVAIDNFQLTATVAVPPACSVTAPGTIASTAGNAFCGTASTTLSLTGTTPSAGISYQWKSSADSINWTNAGTNATLAVTPSGTTFYKCVVKCTTGTSSDSTPGYKITVSPLPSATISGTSDVCSGSGTTITFSGTPDATVTYTAGTITRTILLNGTGVASISPASITSDTTYSIVSVAKGTCSQNISGQQAAVRVTPLPVASVSGGTDVCSGSSAAIRFNGTPNATVTYTAGTLSRTIVLNGSGSATVNPSFTTSDTTYTVVSVTNGTCSQNISGQQTTVQVLPPPVVSIGNDTALCAGASAVIGFTGTPGATVAYNAGTSGRTLVLDGSGSAVLAHTFTSDTVYTILSVTKGSCTQPVTGEQANVHVYPLPAATVQAGGATLICEGDSVALTAPAGTGYSYQWKNGVLDAGQDQVYYAKTTGDYKVIVTDTNNCTDSSKATVPVTAHALPVISIAQGDTSFCAGGVIYLEVTTADTGLGFRWKDRGTDVPNATAGFLEISSTGIYSVVAGRTSVANCAVTSVPVNVTVYPVIRPEIRWDGITLHTGAHFVSYQWFAGGLQIGKATDSTFVPWENGAYTVVATDSNGCISTSLTYNVRDVSATQISDTVSGDRVQLYPNPTTGVIHIHSAEAVNVILGSMDGKQVLEQKQVRAIDLGRLADGVYLLRILDQNGTLIRNERVVKRSL